MPDIMTRRRGPIVERTMREVRSAAARATQTHIHVPSDLTQQVEDEVLASEQASALNNTPDVIYDLIEQARQTLTVHPAPIQRWSPPTEAEVAILTEELGTQGSAPTDSSVLGDMVQAAKEAHDAAHPSESSSIIRAQDLYDQIDSQIETYAEGYEDPSLFPSLSDEAFSTSGSGSEEGSEVPDKEKIEFDGISGVIKQREIGTLSLSGTEGYQDFFLMGAYETEDEWYARALRAIRDGKLILRVQPESAVEGAVFDRFRRIGNWRLDEIQEERRGIPQEEAPNIYPHPMCRRNRL